MRKSPMDVALYQILIQKLHPDLIIEIGTNYGGGSLYFADLLDTIGQGEIHTIDIEDHGVPSFVKSNSRIKFFLGGWENYLLPKNFIGKKF